MRNGLRERSFLRSSGRAVARAALTLLALAALAQSAAVTVDLVPVGLTRIGGGAESPPPTPVRVAIVVRNASRADMTAEQAAAGWSVQVQGSPQTHVIRHALRAGEEHLFAVTVVVPCGKVTPLEVRVNTSRSVGEANLDNNHARFPVQGNACPIAVRTGAS
jgi:hypothetical protein